MSTCNCELLDDEDLVAGYTCYNCYETRKDNSNA